MASISNIFRRFDPRHPGTLRECRRCGTMVETSADECPECDSAEIATYRIAP